MKRKSWLTLALGTCLLLGMLVLPTQSPWFTKPQAAQAKPNNYRFLDLFYVRRVAFLVYKNYVNRDQIKPEAMFFRALKSIQLVVPSIMIKVAPDKKSVDVFVARKKRKFRLKPFTLIMDVPYQLQRIFKFIDKHYKGDVKRRKIEFAAIHGMLKTLDIHTAFLPPSYYKEMQLSVGGKFGGLGIVIQNRDGQLTVVSPMPGTPAYRMGIKPLDKIVRIGDESTINMSLNDAVSKLRGKEGTKIEIWISRKSFSQPKKFVITRAIIKVKSVNHRLLPGNVAYIQITNFQQNTSKELRAALWKMYKKTEGLKGLVLDLRDNPGGLLDQAIQVSDTFLRQGVIVTHEGASSKRKQNMAQDAHTEPNYPLVVLLNRGSASASEIVAGALKNNQRALVLGQRSYGKGTVQVLYPLTQQWPLFGRGGERCALKLTIAQYLTPGDISIQKIGVSPDIALRPTHIERKALYIPGLTLKRKGEKLPAYLKATKEQRKPLYNLSYLDTTTEAEKRKREQQRYARKSKFYMDYEISFARKLILRTKRWKRAQFYGSVRNFLDQQRVEERKKIHKALKKLGIDWKKASAQAKKPTLSVSYRLLTAAQKPKKGKKLRKHKPRPLRKLNAGQFFTLRVRVKNTGKQTAHRVLAVTRSSFWFLNRKKFAFGKLSPKQSKSWDVRVELPKWVKPQIHPVKIVVQADTPKPTKIVETKAKLAFNGPARPRFAFSYAIEERTGNNDQLLQAGEEVSMRITIKNLGPGDAPKVLALIKNKTGRELFIHRGRITLGRLKAGKSVTGWFHFRVHPKAKRNKLKLQLNIFDAELLTNVNEQLSLRVYPGELELRPIRPKKAYGRVKEHWSTVYSGASLDTPRVARVAKGSTWKLLGQLGAFYQIALPASMLGRRVHNRRRPKKKYKAYGWLAARDLKLLSSGRNSGARKLKNTWQYVTPDITLAGNSGKPRLVTQESFQLAGEVRDNTTLRDVYILVNKQKVFYRDTHNLSRLKFNLKVKLKKGSNRVTVVARETESFAGFQDFLIYYDPAKPKKKKAAKKPAARK